MATPFDQAAEQVAPARATTNFFAPGQESVLSRYANARGTLGSARELADSAGRLGASRWEVLGRKRQQETWGREDEEYNAKKSFEAKRGEFLTNLARIDETADDYEETMNELMATTPKELWDDPAAKPMLTYKQRVNAELRQSREAEAQAARYEEGYRKRYEEKAMRDAVAKAAEAGVDPGRVDEYLAAGNWQGLLYEAGRAERAREAGETGGIVRPKATDATREIGVMTADPEAYPRTNLDAALETYRAQAKKPDATYQDFMNGDPTGYNRAYAKDNMSEDARIADALRYQTRGEYMNVVDDPRAREVRGRVWDLAHGMYGGDELLPLDERARARGAVNLPGQPTAEAAAPATPAPEAEKTVNGVRYVKVGGQWFEASP
jgi:hypothetical protein